MENEDAGEFTLARQTAAAWLLVRKYDQAVVLDALTDKPLSGVRLEYVANLLGRRLLPDDLARLWTLAEAAYVAERLIVALISGCVPMPRTAHLPITELLALGLFGTGCLPHGATVQKTAT